MNLIIGTADRFHDRVGLGLLTCNLGAGMDAVSNNAHRKDAKTTS